MQKKYSIKKFCKKLVVCVIVLAILAIADTSIMPLITNQVSMNQMQISDNSFYVWSMYQSIKSLVGVILAVIIILVFRKDIKQAYKKIKEFWDEKN